MESQEGGGVRAPELTIQRGKVQRRKTKSIERERERDWTEDRDESMILNRALLVALVIEHLNALFTKIVHSI